MQTCVLKVNIHCDGCKHKVKKILQKIEGKKKKKKLPFQDLILGSHLFHFPLGFYIPKIVTQTQKSSNSIFFVHIFKAAYLLYLGNKSCEKWGVLG